MKLIRRTSRTFIYSSMPLLLLAGIGLYFTLRHLVQEEIDDSLRYVRVSLIPDSVLLKSESGRFDLIGDVILIKPAGPSSIKESFSDTLFYSEIEGEVELFRKYTFTTDIRGNRYEVTICRKRIENKDLLIQIGGWIFGFLIALVFLLSFINWRITRRLLAPFYRTLQSIKAFSFDHPQVHQQAISGIEEFDELNQEVQKMTMKMQQDYNALKQFTANASHELQTPLSVIRSKTELLAQDIHDPDLMHSVEDIRSAVSKLTTLNQSLLLLARIENRQFVERKTVSIDTVLLSKLEGLAPVIEGNELTVTTDINPMTVIANQALLESMLSNLLINSIGHNVEHGRIEITLMGGTLKIRNTGLPLKKPPAKLFERFSKDEESGPGTGLGLAIVKEICVQHGWKITYGEEAGWHTIIVDFAPAG
jgi:signal transduction histidine kinase